MTRGKGYERLGARAARGEFDLVEPLDYLLLGMMEDEGTTFAGLYQLGTPVKRMTEKLGGEVGPSLVAGRVHALNVQGLCRRIRLVAAGKGRETAWQRTERGKALYEQWKGADHASSS